VIAKNFRDQHPATIPVSIGRHIHVNRPSESERPGSGEFFSERAQAIHDEYVNTLVRASGRTALPLNLLLEFHSHQRTPQLEIATTGVSEATAQTLAELYSRLQARALLPDLGLEPLHPLRMTAEATKRFGSLRPAVTKCALHIEVPREFRRGEAERRVMCRALIKLAEQLMRSTEMTTD
jgi:hypothetical protein